VIAAILGGIVVGALAVYAGKFLSSPASAVPSSSLSAPAGSR
jgi:hypothetical protein